MRFIFSLMHPESGILLKCSMVSCNTLRCAVAGKTR
ncbi:Uncharacterised protein [Vibrio cholerae]|nr:Uncharacterised protein [Vibrio cholerae]